MKTTLEIILEKLEREDVYLVSEDHKTFLHLVRDHHRCFVKINGGAEEEMKMSDDLIIRIMLHGEQITAIDYQLARP